LLQTEVNDNDSVNQIVAASTTATVMINSTENHISFSPAKVCRPPLTTTVNVATAIPNKTNQRMTCTSIAEDSDSTNNSLASSSGIGGSRDCSGVGVEEENMLTSFEGILLNGAPASNNMDIDAQEDGSSKDSSSVSSKEKPLQSMMLVDLLERKVDKEPILNGVLSKNSINEKEMDLVENHIKKVLKESPAELKMKSENSNVIQNEVSEDTLIEAPRGIKRSASESDELEIKKPKYSNGTISPDPAVDSTTAESTVSSIKSEEQDDDKDSEKATVSSTAANLYAALAADCIEDETDLEEQMNVNKDAIKEETVVAAAPPPPPPPPPPPLHVKTDTTALLVKEDPPTLHIKEEPHIFINQITQMSQPPPPQQQQLIVATPRQIVVQQTIPSNNQMIIPTTSVKGRPSPQPQVLLQQSAGGQLQYVVSGGVPGQNYVLAQPQTALVQGQAQTVLVAQTTQQQGTGTKTIIILQPQAATQPTPQKMVAVTPQGQQVVVTQVPRPILQSPALGNIPPPLVPTSATIPQTSIIVNSSVAQTGNPSTVTVTIPAMAQQTPVSTSVPSRVVTPTPASTPPPTRPTTPHQAAATHGVSAAKPLPATKMVKTVSSSTSTEPESKPSTSQQQSSSQENKTITIKIDPNAYLCEWRGCLR
jgi:AT-rich interactive domain-containing protein 2